MNTVVFTPKPIAVAIPPANLPHPTTPTCQTPSDSEILDWLEDGAEHAYVSVRGDTFDQVTVRLRHPVYCTAGRANLRCIARASMAKSLRSLPRT